MSMAARMEEGAGDSVTTLINGVEINNDQGKNYISKGYGPYSNTLTNGYTVKYVLTSNFVVNTGSFTSLFYVSVN